MKFQILISLVLISAFLPTAGAAQTTLPAAPKLGGRSSSSGGEPCTLKLSDSPTLRGLRLDMSKAQVQQDYPLMTITADPVKSSGIALSHQISKPEYQDDIDRITVMFRNDKVFSILLTYTDAIGWDSMEEFADKVSKSLRLPKANLRKRAGGDYFSVNCGGFGVHTRINTEKQPTLLLTRDPDELWETTRQKKDAFKP
jgi:hypothetical protein